MGFQKLSARPPEDRASEWISVPYDESVFTADVMARYPQAFLTQPIPAPPRPDPTPTASPAPNSAPSTVEPKPPIPVMEVKKEESEHSHSSQGTESDYNGDWWNEWSVHGWNDWSHNDSQDTRYQPNDAEPSMTPPQSGPNFPSHETSWADANPETPRPNVTETPVLSLAQSNSQSPAPTAYASGTTTTDPMSYRLEQVTVHTKTQSVEVRPNDGTALTSTNDMLRLQRLAITGAPLTREDRLARQTLASRLSLSPELYNLLVFGESEDTDPFTIESGTESAPLPLAPDPSHSP